ncbi:MAG: serine/threonine protein kinase [Proteobacteria bacterium]|nr:serine/threonine protein kinase [Pseudomonadota bacterium]
MADIETEEQESINRAGAVVLDDRFDIFPAAALPQYDSPSAKAFVAMARREEGQELMALMLEARSPAQIEAMEQLRNFPPPALMRLVDWGIIDWPPENRRLMAVIVERPGGDRVMPTMQARIQPFDETQIVKALLQPLLPVMKELQGRNLTHRSIRPTNLFYTDAARKQVMLGESVTSPPGFHQAHYLETIESAMGDPAGRGRGRFSDDIYSLGATILTLAIGQHPVPNLRPDELVMNKINFGSYNALASQHRVSLPVVELVRGLLSDDLKERWSLREVELWIGGRRLSPKQPKLPRRAPRPLEFLGHEYFNARAVSAAFALEWRTSAATVRSPVFDVWLRRSLSDEQLTARMDKVVGPAAVVAAGGGSGADGDRLVTRACMALDGAAPLRFKGLSVMIDGIGDAVDLALDKPERKQLLAELISSRLPLVWLSNMAEGRNDLMRLHQTFERLPMLLNQTAPGYGYERIHYELNIYAPCLSPLVEKYYATKIDELLLAMEAVAGNRSARKEEMLDRHLAAFLPVRCKQMSDAWLRPLADPPDTPNHLIGVLKIMALVQQTAKVDSVPALTDWLAEMMKPVIESYHNLRQRKRLTADLERAGKSGRIGDVLTPFNDLQALDRDEKGYNSAALNYVRTNGQITLLEQENENRMYTAQQMGEQVAAITSGAISSLVAGIIFVSYFL